MPPLGGGESELWRRARERCLACGSEGLLDEGYLAVKDRMTNAEVLWVGPPTTTDFHFGFQSEREEFPLRARRCRECRHVVFIAEAED